MSYLIHPPFLHLSAGSWQPYIRTSSSSKAFPPLVCSTDLRAYMTRRRKIPRRSWAQTAPGSYSASTQKLQTGGCRSTRSEWTRQYLKVSGLRVSLVYWWLKLRRTQSLNISLTKEQSYMRQNCVSIINMGEIVIKHTLIGWAWISCMGQQCAYIRGRVST